MKRGLPVQVVVLSSRPVVLDDTSQSSAMDLSVIIDEADQRRNVSGRGRKSSLVAWETTLEDVLEDEDEEEEEEGSVMEGTVLEAGAEEDEEEEDETTMEEEKVIFYRFNFKVKGYLIMKIHRCKLKS